MKLKPFILALTGALLFQQSALTQTGDRPWPTNAIHSPGDSISPTPGETVATNAPAPLAETAQSSPATAPSEASVPVPAPMAPPPVAPAPMAVPPAAPAAAVVLPVAPAPISPSSAPVSQPAMAVPAAAVRAPDTSAAPANTNAVSAAATIPIIEFQDVPLTVAIENLARQAGINYLLDPKIGYGQPDQNGQIKPEPTLSIRWENVTAQQALLALLNNYDLQLIQDPKTEIGRITTKDPLAPPPLVTRVIQLKYSSTSNMVQSVQAAFTDRRSHVLADSRTSQLVVVATEPEQDAVDMLVKDLDKPTRQVLIETKLVEVSSTPSSAKGVNWSGTLAGQNVSFGNGVLQPGPSSESTESIPGAGAASSSAGNGGHFPTGGSSGNSTATTLTTYPQPSVLPGGLSWNTLTGLTPAIGFLNADGVQAVLSFLNSTYDAQTLSTPRVVTLDNEPAEIDVTRQFPVINVTASTPGVSSGSSSISYSNIGTTLQVTPRITANDYIWLKVIPDVSSFFATVSKEIAGQTYQADEFDTRHIETQVMIPNGNTLVMGGLIQDNPTASYTEVPVLGSIPVLGWAFKSQSVTLDKENLVIFITPTIVKDTDFQPAETDFLASKPFEMREPMNPNNIWDRPEPDWSNPAPSPNEFSGVPPNPQ